METLSNNTDLKQIDERGLSLRIFLHSLKCSLISFLSAIIVIVVAMILLGGGPNMVGANRGLGVYVATIVIAPLLETIVFQLLVIWGLTKVRFLKPSIVIVISAVLFASYHNPIKAIVVFPLGLVLACVFCYWRERSGTLKWAFTATCLTHALHNAYNSLTFDFLLGTLSS